MTNLSRRSYLGMLAATAAVTSAGDVLAKGVATPKGTFNIARGWTYLNGARDHPLSEASVASMKEYLDHRTVHPTGDLAYYAALQSTVKRSFAQLINADPAEISCVPGTMAGENLVLAGLGLRAATDAIVTDVLHYRGSMYLYQSLSKRGFDVRFVKPRGNRIELEDLDASIDGKTKLVALSLVSYMNGFQHDLKAVCNAAHAKGALVYADLVQAAGAVPVDVRDAGVDFCACSGYKWLMGDKGLGFLYVRKDLLGSRVHRTQFGEDQMINYLDHLYPTDPPVGEPASWSQLDDAGGYFEVGSVSTLVAAGLIPALEYLNSRTIAAIQAARRPLMQRLMQEVPKLGYACITPTPDTGIISFLAADRHLLEPKMKAARVSISFIEHTMRISPSVYNTHADIDRLLHVLAG